jgi:hypothetical protein
VSAAGEPAARARRLIGDVQTFGLVSAAAVAERYVETVDRYLSRHQESADGPAQTGEDPLARAAEQMAQAWLRSVDLLSSALDHRLAGGTSSYPDPLVLPPARPGTTSSASLWVHNPTGVAAQVVVRLGTLTAVDGTSWSPDAVVVEPSGGVGVEAGGSAEVRVVVRVPQDATSGHVHGVALCADAPERPLPVRLEVLPVERSG